MTTAQHKVEFSWRAHPARQRPAAAVGAASAMIGIAAVAGVSFGWLWGVGAGVALLFSLNRFFFPSRFEIDPEGMSAWYPFRRQRIRWADTRRFHHDGRGGYLASRADPSRLDAFSGMHVLFGRDRDIAIAQIRGRLLNSYGRSHQPLAAIDDPHAGSDIAEPRIKHLAGGST